MRRLLSIRGGVLVILSFFVTIVNAKPATLTAISITSPTSDLSDRLAADKDFQDFAFMIYEFSARTQSTKSGKLVLNYFEHKITDEETKTMLGNLGFVSQTDFNAFWKKIYELKLSFQKEFPELVNLENAKEIVETAAQKVALEKDFSKLSKYPTSYCWEALAAQLSFCMIVVCNGASDWENCMAACTAIAITGSGLCFLLAD